MSFSEIAGELIIKQISQQKTKCKDFRWNFVSASVKCKAANKAGTLCTFLPVLAHGIIVRIKKESGQRKHRSIKCSLNTRFYDFIIGFEIILWIPICVVISFIIGFFFDQRLAFPGNTLTNFLNLKVAGRCNALHLG